MQVVIHDMNREEFQKIYEKLKVEVIEKKIKKSRNWIENNEEYSPFVKNVLDRSIPYLLPFFKLKNDEMHHTIRYKRKLFLEVYFYGKDLTELEKNIAEKTVKANCINLNVKKFNVSFLENII